MAIVDTVMYANNDWLSPFALLRNKTYCAATPNLQGVVVLRTNSAKNLSGIIFLVTSLVLSIFALLLNSPVLATIAFALLGTCMLSNLRELYSTPPDRNTCLAHLRAQRP